MVGPSVLFRVCCCDDGAVFPVSSVGFGGATVARVTFKITNSKGKVLTRRRPKARKVKR